MYTGSRNLVLITFQHHYLHKTFRLLSDTHRDDLRSRLRAINLAEMVSSAHSNRLSALLLLFIQLAGIYCMFGVAYQNGYVQSIIDVLTSKHPLLPGSENPVLLKFFRIPLLDHLLSLAQVMYTNFFDGSSPQSSLYALQFGGQLVSVSVII